ncbi:TIGR01777 family oxidoreductase [Desertihabitans aurantiacus]|uniref:TIGR01777 family oxidoreductase n=1 Tax=Desertihabitans aurantiacus TaxID=2282477 RepID=UPI000DF78F59|nr:TIGR01777 family oxidoreductase [Desertihabitans aurantiacus]
MRIAVGGSSGLIGQALVRALRHRGDEVVRLVRRPPREPGEREWDPGAGAISEAGLTDVDAVVNLAGAGIADRRWNAARRQLLLTSRLETTRTVVSALATSDRCRVFLSGSAVGFYGDRGEDELTEADRQGEGFLADLVGRWEDASRTDDVRVVQLRTGIVLAAEGGMLDRQLPLFRIGAGGRLGDGRQWMPWISLRDTVAAQLHLLEADLSGPVNLTGPQPVRNADFTAALGKAVHRPTLVPTPTVGLDLVLGPQLVREALFASQRVLPARLVESGFTHLDTDLAATLRTLV